MLLFFLGLFEACDFPSHQSANFSSLLAHREITQMLNTRQDWFPFSYFIKLHGFFIQSRDPMKCNQSVNQSQNPYFTPSQGYIRPSIFLHTYKYTSLHTHPQLFTQTYTLRITRQEFLYIVSEFQSIHHSTQVFSRNIMYSKHIQDVMTSSVTTNQSKQANKYCLPGSNM